MVMRTLLAVLAAAAVASLLLAGAGVYHARSAALLLAGESGREGASVIVAPHPSCATIRTCASSRAPIVPHPFRTVLCERPCAN
jgi:predicted transporter